MRGVAENARMMISHRSLDWTKESSVRGALSVRIPVANTKRERRSLQDASVSHSLSFASPADEARSYSFAESSRRGRLLWCLLSQHS